jgi:prolyl 4-hydroxylase
LILGSGNEKEQYIQLCRGNDLRPPKVTKDLYCKYENRNKGYYMYGPRKVEIVSFEPHIAVIHDFITDGEIKAILELAAPKLKRSGMLGSQYNGTMDDYR